MALSPISFTGLSKFSDDFQTILQRSFTVANLPVQSLQTEQGLLLQRQSALSNLAVDVRNLQESFTGLGLLGARGAATSSSSDTAVATVVAAGTPTLASFVVDVTSAASVAQETALSGLPDTDTTGLTSDGIYKLTLDATTTTIDLLTIGSGRAAGTTGATTPTPPVSVQVDFSNGLTGSITAELDSFLVASAAPSTIGAGDTVSVTFVSQDGSINEAITTAALTGTEDTAAVALALNTQISANSNLAGKISFSDEGGVLKLVVSDTAGTGFDFTSSSTGTTVSGLESGGTVGGHSAEEIATALNAQVALDQTLVDAGVSFTAANGEVKLVGDQAFDVTVSDSAQGTGFVSGLAGSHSVAGFPNTLAGLVDYFNANSSAVGVSATIINTSSDPDNADYHLTLTANDTGSTTLKLTDGLDADLLTAATQGTDAIFTVNGLAVTNSGNTISNFAPGRTVTIVGPGQTTVSTATDRVGIVDDLRSVVEQYNQVVSRLAESIGKSAGILTGELIVRQAVSTLRDIISYTGSGDIKSFAPLGFELDEKGVRTLDETVFNALDADGLDQAIEFIGDTTSGFAGNAFNLLKSLADPVSSQIQTALDFVLVSDKRLAEQIDVATERVDRLIANLEQQFAAADLLLSGLEAQQRLLTILFDPANNKNIF